MDGLLRQSALARRGVWDSYNAAVNEALERIADRRRILAFQQAIGHAAAAAAGRFESIPPSSVLAANCAADLDNRVTQVCLAVIESTRARRDGRGVEGAWASAREALSSAPRPAASRLYTAEWTSAWADVLERHGLPPVLAARVSVQDGFTPRGFIDAQHYTVLPLLTDECLRFARDLDAAGRGDDARALREGTLRLAADLFRSERRMATCLLAADLVQRVVAESPTVDREVARDAAAWRDGLRRALHDAAAGPTDWTEVSTPPSPAPREYRRMAGWFSASLALMSATAGVVLRLVGGLAVKRTRRRPTEPRLPRDTAPSFPRKREPSGEANPTSAVARDTEGVTADHLGATGTVRQTMAGRPRAWLFALLVGGAFATLVASRFWRDAPVWGRWPVMTLVAAALLGLLTPSAWRASWSARVLLLAAMLLPMIEPSAWVRVERTVRTNLFAAALLVGSSVALGLGAFLAGRRRGAGARKSGATVCLDCCFVFALLSATLITAHRAAYRDYNARRAAVEADEVVQRLGEPRWRETVAALDGLMQRAD